MEQVNVNGFGGAAVAPSRGYFVNRDLKAVLSYGTKLVSGFHQCHLDDTLPCGFTGFMHTLDATLATLRKVSGLFKDESAGQRYSPADHPLNEDGLSYLQRLVQRTARAFGGFELAIVDACLPTQEYRDKIRRDVKFLKKNGRTSIEISTLNLDEKVFLGQLEHTNWDRAEDKLDDCLNVLNDIQLCLLLIFQVVTVGALSKDLSAGTVDVAAIVSFHNRIKRTARLAGIPSSKERIRDVSHYSSESYDSGSSSDRSTIDSLRKTSRRSSFRPGSPPPVLVHRSPAPLPHMRESTPGLLPSLIIPVSPPPPPQGPLSSQIATETVNPPSYNESHRKIELAEPTSLPDLNPSKGKEDTSEKASASEDDGSDSEADLAEANQPTVLEPRLFKAKPNGFTFKLRTMFRSKESLAQEMQKALADTDSHLMAFVIQGPSQNVIPHSSFHSLETTHMRTILSQLGDDAWCKTFSSLHPLEHATLSRIIHPFANGKFHDRQVLALKVIKERSRITAWTALLGDIRRGNAYSTSAHRDNRIILAIVREQFVDGKPLSDPALNRVQARPPLPPPFPPPPPTTTQYHSSGVFRPPPPPRGPSPMHSNTTISDISHKPLILAPPVINLNRGWPPPPHPQSATSFPPGPPVIVMPGSVPPPPRPLMGPLLNKPASSVRVSDITIGNNYEAEVALTSYKECTMRQCQAETPQASRSWLRVTTTLESSTPESVKACVSRFEAMGGDVLQAKLKLSEQQADQVSRLMDSFRTSEHDMRFEWCWVVLALLDTSGEFLNGNPKRLIQQNSHTLHLIAKRSLKACYRPLDVYNAMMRVPGPPPGLVPRPSPPPSFTLDGNRRKLSVRHSYGDSGSDSSDGYDRRTFRRNKAENRRRDRYTRARRTPNRQYRGNSDSDSGSDSDSEFDVQESLKTAMKLKRGENMVERLLKMWTPQGTIVKESLKA